MHKARRTVEVVLEFLHDAKAHEWYEVAEYVRQQNPIRDTQYSALLRIGATVHFQWPQGLGFEKEFTGNVTKTDRRKGRLHLRANFGDGRLTPGTMPATMVTKH